MTPREALAIAGELTYVVGGQSSTVHADTECRQLVAGVETDTVSEPADLPLRPTLCGYCEADLQGSTRVSVRLDPGEAALLARLARSDTYPTQSAVLRAGLQALAQHGATGGQEVPADD